MRLRSKPWAEDELSKNPRHIQEPEAMRGKYREFFGSKNPIQVEAGCGKGSFIVKTAIQNPDTNYVAVERAHKILAMALRLSSENGLPENLLFIHGDATNFNEYFAPGEIQRIFINFCDPWRSRGKWQKRRLTHRNFLEMYERLMLGGEVFFKTDNRELFEFSVREFEKMEWILKNVTFDLHNSDFTGNVTTEYEEHFSSMGLPIHRLEAYK